MGNSDSLPCVSSQNKTDSKMKKGKTIKMRDKNGVAHKSKDESLLMSGLMDTSDCGLNESRDTFSSMQTGVPLWDVGDDDAYGNGSQDGTGSNLGSYHSS